MPRRPISALIAGASLVLLAGCSQSRSVDVVSECPGDVRVTFAGTNGATWSDPIVVGSEGTSLGVALDVDRVWFVAIDGTKLNEVSLTADQLADADVDFPPLVIRAGDCGRLEAVG